MSVNALLVVDLQEEYIKRYEKELLNLINNRIEKAVDNGENIIYIENIKLLRCKTKKYVSDVCFNLSCVGIMNKSRFATTVEKLREAGVKVD